MRIARGISGLLVTVLLAGFTAQSDLSSADRTSFRNAATHLVQPNIVLIVTDDQTMESVAKMQYVSSRTDWIDFREAFVQNALCCPSRATILSGQYDTRTQVGNNAQADLFNAKETVGVWLQRAGYRTGYFGKYFNGYRGKAVKPGWDDWHVPYISGTQNFYYQYNYPLNANGVMEQYGTSTADYLGNVITRKAVAFITASTNSPFFVYFSPVATHFPWRASPERVGMFRYSAVTQGPNFNEADMTDKPAWIQQRPQLDATAIARVENQRRKEWAGAVSIDDEILQIDNALRAAGVFHNTVMIFMSDNGYSFGEHRWTTKRCEYDECSRTPLLVRYPGQTGRDVDHLISNVDIAPTIAAIAGTVPTLSQDGASFLPLVLNESLGWRDSLLLHWPGGDIQGNQGTPGVIPQFWGVRTASWKYVEFDTGERELYDMAADPYELTNRADDPGYAAAQADLKAKLDALKAAAGASSIPRNADMPSVGPLPRLDFG